MRQRRNLRWQSLLARCGGAVYGVASEGGGMGSWQRAMWREA